MDLPAPDAASEPVTGRRRLLLDAAVTVVAGGVLRALTHRAVDAAAGVPQGSTSTLSTGPDRAAPWLTAHVSWLLGERIAERAQRIAVIEDVDEQARAARIVDEVVLLFVMHVSEPDLVVVQAELWVESVRTPELMTCLANGVCTSSRSSPRSGRRSPARTRPIAPRSPSPRSKGFC